MKRILSTILALVMVAALAPRAQAEMKPVVVVSIASYSDLMAGVDYLGGLAPNAAAKPSVQLGGLAQFMLGAKPEELLDASQPTGVIIGTEGDEFKAVVFAPVSKPDQIFAMLQQMAGVTPEDAGDGIKKFEVENQQVFVKATGGWLFAGESAEALADVPANPATLLDGLNKEYDIAVRAYLQNIPAEYREQALNGLMEGMSMRMPGEDDQSYNARKEMMAGQSEAMNQLFSQLDQLSFGLNIDEKGKGIYLDISMSAVPGSELAQQMSSSKELATRFGGFLRDDAMLSMSVVGEMAESDIEAAKAQMAMVREQAIQNMKSQANFQSEEDEAFVTDLMNELMDMIEETMETGKGDMALTVVGPDHISAALALHVADGSKAEGMFDKVVAFANEKSQGQAGQFVNRNAAKVGDVTFHTITPPTDDMDEEARMILGDNPVVAFGFGEDVLYVGVGTGIMDTLKDMMSQSESLASKPVPPFSMSASVASIMQFASKVSPEAAAFAQGIQPGDDHIRITSMNQGVTSTTRIKVEEGVLKFLVVVGQQLGQQFGAAGAQLDQ